VVCEYLSVRRGARCLGLARSCSSRDVMTDELRRWPLLLSFVLPAIAPRRVRLNVLDLELTFGLSDASGRGSLRLDCASFFPVERSS